MKTKTILIIGIWVALNAANTLAAGRVGNGGGAIVCRDPADGRILSAELYDLYEALHQRNTEIPNSNGSVDSQAIHAVNRFPIGDRLFSSYALGEIKRKMRPLMKGDELILINDTKMIIQKKGCKYEQLANYTEEGIIYYDQEIYDHLNSNTHRAAFLVHETVYAALRIYEDATDSKRARQITAALFSNLNTSEIRPDIPAATLLFECATDYEASQKAGYNKPIDTHFLVYPRGGSYNGMSFSVLVVFETLGHKSFKAEAATHLPMGIFAQRSEELCYEVTGDLYGRGEFNCSQYNGYATWRGKTESNLDSGQEVVFRRNIQERFLRSDISTLDVNLPGMGSGAIVTCRGDH